MARTTITDRATDGLPTADESRRLERKRWFEQAVVVPVSIGMIASFFASSSQHLAAALGAPSWVVEKPWATALLGIVPAVVFLFARLMRR